MAGEKTEKATPKKREDERKKGHVFMSKDLIASGFILAIFFATKLLAPFILNQLQEVLKTGFMRAEEIDYITPEMVFLIYKDILQPTLMIVGPILLLGCLLTIALTGAQTRFLFSMESIKFKMDKLNPIEGIKKMFSLKAAVEVIKNVIKILVIALIIYNNFSSRLVDFARLIDMDILQVIVYIADSVMSIVINIGVIFLFVGVADYLYQWWDYEKNMRMSKDEIKEEYKQMEGDPQLKGKIKQKQREMSQKRMMGEVPNADVIIRNPTHYAVAIKYNEEHGNAPVVVAKGADRIALKIIEIGKEHGVELIEDRPLARALYETVDIDMEIPSEFYQVVAEILATVYVAKKQA